MRLVLYGTLRKGGRNFYKLPTNAHITTTTLSGYEMYELKRAPGVIAGDKEIIVDIWEKDLNWIQETWLLLKLDILEAIYLKLYKRVRVPTPQGEAWMYLYIREIENKQHITDWMHRHA